MSLLPRSRRAKARTAAATSAVAILAGGLALAGQPAGALAQRSHQKPQRARLAADISTAYAVLGRAPTAADQANGIIVGVAQHDTSLVPTAARALTDDAFGTVWLIPTTDGRLCLGVQPGTQYAAIETSRHLGKLTFADTCASDATVDSQGEALRLYNHVIGVAPDGVATVAAALGATTPTTISVDRNVYGLSGASPIHGSATFTNGAGVKEVTPLP